MRSLNTHNLVSKQDPNSPIYSYNNKLKSIVMNKGRIYEEIREIFYISLKFDQIRQ